MNLPFTASATPRRVFVAGWIMCALAVLILTGCVSVPKDMAALVKELAKDPATAYIRLPTPYGTFVFIRTNPSTNSLAHTINPEGVVTVGGQPK